MDVFWNYTLPQNYTLWEKCRQGLNPGHGIICWLGLLLVLFLIKEDFLLIFHFSSHHKKTTRHITTWSLSSFES